MPPQPSLLLTFHGPDRPGITAQILDTLARFKVPILDMSQALVSNALSLSTLIQCPGAEQAELRRELQSVATALGLGYSEEELSLEKGYAFGQSYALTLIGDPIEPRALARITRLLADHALNIRAIRRLSPFKLDRFECVEFSLESPKDSPVELNGLRQALLELSAQERVDVALQADHLFRRAKRLVVMDMDSTLIQNEVIDELAREKGCYEEVRAITHAAMSGAMSYEDSLKQRCAKLLGLTKDDLERVYARITLTQGAETLVRILKKLGYKVAVLSGGFTFVADRLRDRLGLDYAYANQLVFRDGKLTGEVQPPIVGAQRKADLLETIAQQERIALDQVIAIGDGANDLLMLEKAGLGIAFDAKPVVREKADTALNRKSLLSVLYFLGFSHQDIAHAERGQGVDGL